mmetsp:Transcript_11959/g.55484  ORF Transcript_11959/g.55484 Transcript_11959/m.55484 type:complete len:430 (-) Transcript_11959:2140-3429(-)
MRLCHSCSSVFCSVTTTVPLPIGHVRSSGLPPLSLRLVRVVHLTKRPPYPLAPSPGLPLRASLPNRVENRVATSKRDANPLADVRRERLCPTLVNVLVTPLVVVILLLVFLALTSTPRGMDRVRPPRVERHVEKHGGTRLEVELERSGSFRRLPRHARLPRRSRGGGDLRARFAKRRGALPLARHGRGLLLAPRRGGGLGRRYFAPFGVFVEREGERLGRLLHVRGRHPPAAFSPVTTDQRRLNPRLERHDPRRAEADAHDERIVLQVQRLIAVSTDGIASVSVPVHHGVVANLPGPLVHRAGQLSYDHWGMSWRGLLRLRGVVPVRAPPDALVRALVRYGRGRSVARGVIRLVPRHGRSRPSPVRRRDQRVRTGQVVALDLRVERVSSTHGIPKVRAIQRGGSGAGFPPDDSGADHFRRLRLAPHTCE